MKIRSQHIRFEQLADFVEGRVASDQQRQIQQHVSTCTQCANDLAWLQETITVMRNDMLEDAPAHVVARAVRLLRPQTSTIATGLRRIIAVLQFDSKQLRPSLGVRAGQASARQLVFNAGEHDIDLRVAPSGTNWLVSGQLLGPSSTGEVELLSATNAVRAELNDLSEFVLPPVTADMYVLVVHLATAEITISDLDLGNSS